MCPTGSPEGRVCAVQDVLAGTAVSGRGYSPDPVSATRLLSRQPGHHGARPGPARGSAAVKASAVGGGSPSYHACAPDVLPTYATKCKSRAAHTARYHELNRR